VSAAFDWLLTWLEAVPPGTVLTCGGVVVALILVVWKGWPAFRRLVALLAASVKLVDTLATLPDELSAIRHQLEHNGGGSVKDAVTRTEQSVADLRKEVADLNGEVAHVRRQAAALKTSIAKTNRRLDERSAA
jgi:septal ring factor EnvC (AmiA/AmiB activator)